MYRRVAAGILAILAFAILAGLYQVPGVEAAEITLPSVFNSINEYRGKQSLPLLKRNQALDRAAVEKLEHMESKQYWAHFGPDGETPWQFIAEQDYKYSRAGENLAIGYTDDERLIQAWIKSPAHEKNLAGRYSEIGIASKQVEIDGRSGILVVALFAEPKPAPSMSLFSFLSNLFSIVRPVYI